MTTPAADPGRPLRILVVDDIPINQEILASMLRVLQHVVVVVDNGQEALDRLGREAYDLVLMDWHMPGLDGLDATRLHREREAAAGAPRTPIVIVSASTLAGEVTRCLEAGGDAHLAKPFRLDQLRSVVEAWGRA